MGKRFSILIPAFKAKYLKECIDSIINQTFGDFEIIIVNDASPEDLYAIVGKYNDERIKYFTNDKNFGAYDVVKNWNKCLEYAAGKYVICMGDDDCLKPRCLEIYNELIQANPGIGLLHGWTEIINNESKPYLLTTHRCEKESAMSLLWHRIFAYHAQFIGDFCFKRETLIKNKGFYYFPLAWGSDEITSVIAARENGVVNTQEIVFQYRRSPITITQSGNIPEKIDSFNKKIDWINEFLSIPCDDSNDELYRKELIKELPHYAEKQKSIYMMADIKDHSIFRFFYWLSHRNRYQTNWKSVCYSLLRSLF